MESILLAIDPQDPLWIAIAFFCGLGVRVVGLPPLVGFLGAGFILSAAGAESGEFLRITADLGVTLLLFSIGLKLNLRSLGRPEVWGVGVIHMTGITLAMCLFLLGLAAIGVPLFADLDARTMLLISFALCFSSTVFAVKVLDESGSPGSRHGMVSIGVLIIQDIAAVAFLAISSGKIPSLWAIGLLILLPMRHLLQRLMVTAGHGELLVLYGIVLALGGADLFELVGLKGDLGALVLGMLLAPHAKSGELAKALLSFKDLFLVGFFLSVGMTAAPGWIEMLAAVLLVMFLPVKIALYYGLFTLFRLRARSAWRACLNLANYSEFGLIVGTVAAASGLLPPEWLAVFALALSISFVIAAPGAIAGDDLYHRFRNYLKKFETRHRLPGDEDLDLTEVDVLVIGLGRVRTAAYDAVNGDTPGRVLAIDVDQSRIEKHEKAGRRVVMGDGTNPEFWIRAPAIVQDCRWVLLTLPSHRATLEVVSRLRETGYAGRIAAVTRYADDAFDLQAHGVDVAVDVFAEAGAGFVNDLKQRVAVTQSAPGQA